MTLVLLYLISGLAFFLRVISWAIIIDIALGWLSLLGVHIVIGPLIAITHPLYEGVSKIVPTRVGIIDFSPIIIFLVIDVLLSLGIPALIQLIQ